jgi:hypothetical protein
MFKQLGALTTIASLLVLAACSSQQTLSSGSGLMPTTKHLGSAAIRPDKNCGGVHGVTVTPCPIRLTRHTKQGIVVTVAGPKVVNSYLGALNSCFSGKQCYYVERDGSSRTQWLFKSGSACGGADVEFYGVDAQGNNVGYFFLKVSNRYCP